MAFSISPLIPKARDSFLGDVSVTLNLGGVKIYFSHLVQAKKCKDCLISVMGLVLGKGEKNGQDLSRG